MGLSNAMKQIAEAFAPAEVPFTGPDDNPQEGPIPRVYWEPAEATHAPPKRIGGGAGDDGVVFTRQWQVRVFCWGSNFDECEALVDKFIGLTHRLLTHFSFKPGREAWNAAQDGAKGSVCVLTLFFEGPILRPKLQTRTITEVAITTTIINPTPQPPETP